MVKNHLKYVLFSKGSLRKEILKLYSSSLCGYLARCLLKDFISRRKADG